MRDIKFRAWRKSESGAIYRVDEIILSKVGSMPQITAGIGKFKTKFTPDVLMQYTGKKDDKDNEIWECDLVHITYSDGRDMYNEPSDFVGLVFWDENTASFSVKKNDIYIDNIERDLSKTIEVVGNEFFGITYKILIFAHGGADSSKAVEKMRIYKASWSSPYDKVDCKYFTVFLCETINEANQKLLELAEKLYPDESERDKYYNPITHTLQYKNAISEILTGRDAEKILSHDCLVDEFSLINEGI
jgi:hypothetical protein